MYHYHLGALMTNVDGGAPEEHTTLGLGNRRRKNKISLDQIAQETKIGVRALQAIETEDFKKLPGGIYSTSYIRQYAKAIDFDDSQILALYYSVMGITPQLEEAPGKASLSEGSFVSRFLRHTSTVLGSST